MKSLSIIPIAVILLPGSVLAQEPTSTLRGQVVDAFSGKALVAVSVELLPSDPLIDTTTDSSGTFVLRDVPVGHYTLRVAAEGHDTLDVPEVWMRSGKETEQRVELTPAFHELGSVTVSAMAREELSLLGRRPFTVEQSLRWPATFFDPGRFVTAMPGVVGANDQANHLIIRGNSPNANAWTLEGAEIVNPNHLTNAGTPTDLPALSGGGESILSAQMLGTSQLLTGVLPIDRDNALGGIMDMHLRNGNMKKQEWTLQAGLLGIDASTEGPIGSGYRSSYLVNYRYSTIGLLSAIGIDLGDEITTFQDLSFHVALPVGKRGEAHLFGLGGTSSNVFEAVHDTTQWEIDKDSKNIDYTARTGAVGGSVRIPLRRRTSFSSTIALSETDQRRTEDDLRSDYTVADHSDVALSERKFSGTAQVEGSLGARFRYAIGGSAMQRQLSNIFNTEVDGWLLRPWLNGRWSFSDRLQATAGIAWSDFTYNGDNATEPRIGLEWSIPHNRKVALAFGIRSQLPEWQVMEYPSGVGPNGDGIGLTRSQDVVLGYDHSVNDRLTFHVEAYHQQLRNVPVRDPGFPTSTPSIFSMANTWDEPFQEPLVNTGTGMNTGVELSMDHSFANSIFYQANVSLYQSQYSDADHVSQDSRWDGNYILNLLGGKEFKKVKTDRVRTWGVSGRLNVVGGQRTTPIDVQASHSACSTIYLDDPWSEQLATFYRIDLRVYLKVDRTGRTGMWSVDLQNVTNAQNEAYHYFDVRKDAVVTKYQLGIIPNLSYRIEF